MDTKTKCKYCLFSRYKHILGVPNKGIHKYRFMNTAIIDVFFTIIIAIITTYLFKIPLIISIIIWFILGLLMHILFGVQTNITNYLGFNFV
jgi:hypothetical protein